jgi:multiple sugar transport system substrate-binding protein
LNDRIETDAFDLKAYYPELINRFTVNGALYALPQDTAPIACLYYNKAMFKEAGLTFPKGDWSWEQFLKASQKLLKTDASGNTVRWAFMDNYGPDWAGIIYSNGGRLVDDVQRPTRCLIDSPEAVQGLQFLADLMLKHKVSPSLSSRSNVLALGQDEFMQGRVAMIRTGLWITPALRKSAIDWDIAPFPSGPKAKGGKGGWKTGGSGYAIYAKSKRSEDAWKLAKFLAAKKRQMAYVKTGYVQPAIQSLAESREFLDDAPPANKKFLLDAVGRSVYSPMHPRWAEAELAVIENAVTEIWLGNLSAKDAMARAARDVNKLLFETKY